MFHKLCCVLKDPVFFSPADSSPFCFVLYILYILVFVCIYVVSYKICGFWNKLIELHLLNSSNGLEPISIM